MDIEIIPAQVAAITAYIAGKLPRREEDQRGHGTLEAAILIVGIAALALLVIAAITTAVNKRLPGIK